MIRTVTMTVIVKVPTVIATAEDMDTELNLMDPQFWAVSYTHLDVYKRQEWK